MWYSSRTALIQPPPAAVIMIRQVPVFTLWNSWCKTATTGWFQICTLSMVFKYTCKFFPTITLEQLYTRKEEKCLLWNIPVHLLHLEIWYAKSRSALWQNSQMNPFAWQSYKSGKKVGLLFKFNPRKKINTWECQQGYSSHQGPKRTNSILPHSHQHERWSSSEFL